MDDDINYPSVMPSFPATAAISPDSMDPSTSLSHGYFSSFALSDPNATIFDLDGQTGDGSASQSVIGFGDDVPEDDLFVLSKNRKWSANRLSLASSVGSSSAPSASASEADTEAGSSMSGNDVASWMGGVAMSSPSRSLTEAEEMFGALGMGELGSATASDVFLHTSEPMSPTAIKQIQQPFNLAEFLSDGHDNEGTDHVATVDGATNHLQTLDATIRGPSSRTSTFSNATVTPYTRGFVHPRRAAIPQGFLGATGVEALDAIHTLPPLSSRTSTMYSLPSTPDNHGLLPLAHERQLHHLRHHHQLDLDHPAVLSANVASSPMPDFGPSPPALGVENPLSHTHTTLASALCVTAPCCIDYPGEIAMTVANVFPGVPDVAGYDANGDGQVCNPAFISPPAGAPQSTSNLSESAFGALNSPSPSFSSPVSASSSSPAAPVTGSPVKRAVATQVVPLPFFSPQGGVGMITKRSRGRRVPSDPELVSNLGKSGTVHRCIVPGCGKCFKRREHLKRHVKSIHTDDKPFECSFPGCRKRFSRHDNLNQHARVHAVLAANAPSTSSPSSSSSLSLPSASASSASATSPSPFSSSNASGSDSPAACSPAPAPNVASSSSSFERSTGGTSNKVNRRPLTGRGGGGGGGGAGGRREAPSTVTPMRRRRSLVDD